MTQLTQQRTVKILVLGDSGVGKSSLVHILCHNEILRGAPPTIGCNVDVRLHTSFVHSAATSRSVPSISNLAAPNRSMFEVGTQPSFVEFYDISGSPSVRHPKSRNMFYTAPYQGIILVHDICNKRSYDNLWKWMKDYLDVAQTGNGVAHGYSAGGRASIPVFVVGNKKDLASGYDQPCPRQAGDDIAREYGGESISVSSNSLADFLPSSHTFMAFSMFFDSLLDLHQIPTSRHRHPPSDAYPNSHGIQTFAPQAQPSNTEDLKSPTIPVMDFATFTSSTTSSFGDPSSSGNTPRSNTPYSTVNTPTPASSRPASSPHHNSARAQYERNRSILGQFSTSAFPINSK
ncbi:hypothetical protein MVEG_03670 [Podila verticillata NRRL 6337]|nr:hypothetical protein MVEG_03670 [Podila verticillata NRRL 6337]